MSVSPPKHEHPVGSESQLWERHLVESLRLTDGRCVVFFFYYFAVPGTDFWFIKFHVLTSALAGYK